MLHFIVAHSLIILPTNHRFPGPVVRVYPCELYFAAVAAWKQIYTPKLPKGSPRLLKNEFYTALSTGRPACPLAAEHDPTTASRMRNMFIDAMSTRGLKTQEGLMREYVDRWVDKVAKLGAQEGGVDMTKWSILAGLDIIGWLGSGHEYECMENGKFPVLRTYHFESEA
jgi:cytochrome P450